jgi:hypothetical protein
MINWKCPVCGADNNENDSLRCSCGYELEVPRKMPGKRMKWVYIVFLLFFSFVFLLFYPSITFVTWFILVAFWVHHKNKKAFFLVANVLYIGAFCFVGYASYGVTGEGAMLFVYIMPILSAPAGLLMAILLIIFKVNPLSDISYDVLFFVVGYSQWFILLPWLTRQRENTG